MRINKDKTKAMAFRRSVQSDGLTLSIHGTQVEYVQNFIYLGSMISWNNDCTLYIIRRIQLTTIVYAGFRTIWKDKNITVDIKLNLLTTCVFSVLFYAADTLTIKKEDEIRFLAFEMRCYRNLLTFDGIRKSTMTASDNN